MMFLLEKLDSFSYLFIDAGSCGGDGGHCIGAIGIMLRVICWFEEDICRHGDSREDRRIS